MTEPNSAPAYWQQTGAQVWCEWGLAGLQALAPASAAVVIVDVLSFCTAVDIAVGRGALVWPFRGDMADAAALAAARGAVLAGPRSDSRYSLSPATLTDAPAGIRLVLPSPNGAALSVAAGRRPTYAACLRNARAVAAAAAGHGAPVAVIPAGERWRDGTLRPALEDWLGAGAVIHHLPGARSPEAAAAEALFVALRSRLTEHLHGCASGRKLVERGFAEDVALAAALNASPAVPALRAGAYTNAAAGG